MSQGYCPLPECKGYCCVHLDKRITELEAELRAAILSERERCAKIAEDHDLKPANRERFHQGCGIKIAEWIREGK